MTYSNESLHVYLREIRQGERTSLSVLASMVSSNAKVLDLGTGSGALGKDLHEKKACTVDGVTINQAEADVARPHYRRLEIADLDTGSLPALFAGERYDFIICADVLEHLKYPERVLDACRAMLAPGGKLLLSIPNAAYSGLLAELLQGDLRYRDEGLLDRTHLRFFTRRSLARFLGEHAWSLDAVEAITLDLTDSEFQVAFDSLPPAVSRYLLATPDGLTYQLVASASPSRPSQEPSSTLPGVASAQALFTAQLYLGDAAGFAENRKLVASGVIGNARQSLVFRLPQGASPLAALRLDPADRPGFLHLYRIALRTVDGTVLWEWRCDVDGMAALDAATHHQMLLRAPWIASPATLALLYGDDPWIELPIPKNAFARCNETSANCELAVELGWPMSADYVALSDQVAPLSDRMASLKASASVRIAALEASATEERRAHDAAMALARSAAEKAAADALSEIGKLQADLATQAGLTKSLQQQNRLLFTQKGSWQDQIKKLNGQIATIGTERDNLITHLQWIENSTVFRATRPLVKLKMAMDKALGRTQPVRPTAVAVDTPPQARAPDNGHPVDVIVPVYRGLEDTQRCIRSVLSSACRTPFRLLVINDASPEPEVTQWLRSISGEDARVTLLENPENLGFVATVNRGMSLSDTNDVLLLNSDTEVANDWLDRLRRAAYTDERTATVTPFSNNATICSYPRFCEPNALPAGYDTARLDAVFARTLDGQVIDIPTGVGFCMYIRRDCLARIGLFDVESFGKGYGEENDFCHRASTAGWRNLHALDTFVLHAGGVSFGGSKSAREIAAMETLRRMYPDYEPAVHRFVAVDPARLPRLAVDLARVADSRLPVILAVVHDRGGGTLRHVTELAEHLRSQAVFFKLTPSAGQEMRLTLADDREAFELAFRLPGEYEDLLLALRSIGVRHIHFHHLIGHGPQTLDLPAQLGVSYDFTAHDFYTFCPQISLTDHTDRYCGERGLAQCHGCLQRSPAPGGESIEAWRSRHGAFLAQARHVLAPSRDAAQRLIRFVPAADVRFAPHTDAASGDSLPAPAPTQLGASAPLRVVVIGALSIIKGADVLEDVATAAARQRAPLEFHLIGYAYRNLRTQPHAALTVHGQYEEKDLPQLLEWLKPDLVWFPALWPETYSYTLSTCLLRGLPVAAPDLGAFPERLSGRRWSWVRPWAASAQDWLDFFVDIRAKHFVTGQSPAPSWYAAPTAENALVKEWSYGDFYLADLARPAQEAPLSLDFLAGHRPGRAEGMLAAKMQVKQHILLAIVRLRSAALLRPVARAIPLRWQTRVKSWLRA